MALASKAAVGERLVFGEFELAPVARTLWRAGVPVKLGSRALEILISLASRPGEVLSKDVLTRLVWGDSFVDETALRVGVSAARKALGEGGERYIATVPGRGYCFVLDVEATPTKFSAEETGSTPPKAHRLPSQLVRIVGRDAVIEALVENVSCRRFISLVGPGGIGKTTVALAVTTRLREPLGFSNGLAVERGHPLRETFDKGLEFVIRYGAIDPAIPFRKIGVEVVAAEQDLQRPAASHERWQAFDRPADGQKRRTHLELGEDRALATGEPDVAGQGELRAASPRPSAHRRDRNRWKVRKPLGDFRPRIVAAGLFGGQVLVAGGWAEVGDEEVGVGAVEHHHLEVGFRLGEIEQSLELRHGVVVQQIDRRVIEGHAPVGAASAAQAELFERLAHKNLRLFMLLAAPPDTRCRVPSARL